MILFYCFCIMAAFCLLLIAADLAFVTMCYVVYKMDGGKMGIIKYFKKML